MPVIAKQQIFRLSTNENIRCPICDYTTYAGNELAFNDVCNHLLQEHKLKCLHVGQETRSSESGPWHSTVAVFGR